MNERTYVAVLPPPLEIVGPQDPRKMTVVEAIERYVSLRMAEGVILPYSDHFRHTDLQLRRSLVRAIGPMPLSAVKADHIREWMNTLRNGRTGALLQAWTLRHYLKAAKTLFKRAVAEEWIDRDPCRAVVPPKLVDKPVNILGVRDAFECFKVNVDNPAISRLALEAFGALRCSTAGLIAKDSIKFERRGIDMPASIHKSKARKYRQGHTANLWAWLQEATDATWALPFRAYVEAKKIMHYRAGLRKELNPYGCLDPAERKRQVALRNVWRHSFASYHMALFKNPSLTAYFMQHGTSKITAAHYEGSADEQDGKLYFAITPAAVRSETWDEFCIRVIGVAKPVAADFVGDRRCW